MKEITISGADKERFWDKVEIAGPDDCWEWTSAKVSNGYGYFWLDDTNVYAHRLSWEMENGAVPDGLQVCHHCDNPSCVNPAHLFIGTAQDNSTDMVNKGRQITPGTIDATDEKVITIRQQYATGLFSRSELAELHGVSEGQVQSYNSGTYKNFPNMVRLRKIKVNGGALKSIRLAKNLTQNDVEITLGLGQGAMSRMERGRLPESYLYSVSRLAEYFGVEVDSITR